MTNDVNMYMLWLAVQKGFDKVLNIVEPCHSEQSQIACTRGTWSDDTDCTRTIWRRLAALCYVVMNCVNTSNRHDITPQLCATVKELNN